MKKKRWLLVFLVLLLAGGVVYHASLPAPTGPAQGVALEGQVEHAPTERRTLRIATLNIHGGKGRDGQRDLGRVAACLVGLDFVALNEVHGPALWQPENQAEQLGQQLGMAWLFAPASRTWYHVDFGNALVTALPVSFWQRIPLSHQSDHGLRNVVLVGLQFQGRTVHVLLTHISRQDDAEREAQLRAVIALFRSLAEPAILLGDLNSNADDPQIRELLAVPGVSDPVGEILTAKSPGKTLPERIDWIITRGFRGVDAEIHDCGASDHPLIWAELDFPPPPADDPEPIQPVEPEPDPDPAPVGPVGISV
jgi:endonuclease/exonuclease/phosphatase family metal-dependent hydrolase